MNSRQHLKDAKRIVIKIGSSSLTHHRTGHISLSKLEQFVRQISDLKNEGIEVIVVTSGAQAVGISALNLEHKPEALAVKQAVAAVGQASLMMLYQKLFREYNHQVGQVLLTKDGVDDDVRYRNAKNTLLTLLDMGVIPVVNENDTVSTEEIEFGDNDRLSATVAIIAEADLLILLSDIDGLYDRDPRHHEDVQIIEQVNDLNEEVMNMAGDTGSKVGTGGMATKLLAASMVTQHGIDMIIANAGTKYIINQLHSGKRVGTLFKGK